MIFCLVVLGTIEYRPVPPLSTEPPLFLWCGKKEKKRKEKFEKKQC